VFHVFDYIMSGPFKDRLAKARDFVGEDFRPKTGLVMVPHSHIGAPGLLAKIEQQWVDDGFEGVMLRDPVGPYKFGRSTAKEGYLLKMKRFEDHEATVVGVVEQMRNENEATKDALGRTKRSTAKAGKVGKDTLGAFRVKASIPYGVGMRGFRIVEFEIGSGMNDAQRAEFWKSPPIGALVTFKCQGFTPDGLPRFPIFKGIRQDAA
jgi:DNA ligase-1